MNVQPEYEDCLRVARDKGLPLKEVLKLAMHEFMTKERPGRKSRRA